MFDNQNQRLSNILQGMIALQLASNDTDTNPQDSTTMSSGENKRKRAAVKKEDEIEPPPAKRTRSATPTSSTEVPYKIDAHADEAAKPIPFGDGREYQAFWEEDQYIFEDRIVDFLYDVPGWGPNRVVPPEGEVEPVTIGGPVYDDEEELMFTMDDLFDFDRYYAS